MAFILLSGVSPDNAGAITVPKTAAAIVVNALLQKAMATNNVEHATDNAVMQAANAVFAVSNQARAAADATVSCVPINDSQIWRADGSADSAANQLLERVSINSHLLVQSDQGDTATTAGIFEILMNVGVAADRLQLGRFIGGKQVTA